jgi:membrane-bound ClpP family serine protease
MNLSWRDTWITIFAIIGGIEVFAKLRGYSWWLIGSWKGAIAVLGVVGILMLLVSLSELNNWRNWFNRGEAVLWLAAAVLVVVGLFAASEAMFYTAAIVLGITWLALLTRHSWHTTHQHPTYMATH